MAAKPGAAITFSPIALRVGSWTISPSWVMQDPLTISSSKFTASSPSLTSSASRLVRFFAKSSEETAGTMPAGLVTPWIWTPYLTTTFPGSVSSQLPPASAAMSTTTEPGFMPITISLVSRIGAGRPWMRAVVMTTSAWAACLPSSSRCRRRKSSDCSFA